jgi:hypothetical protein
MKEELLRDFSDDNSHAQQAARKAAEHLVTVCVEFLCMSLREEATPMSSSSISSEFLRDVESVVAQLRSWAEQIHPKLLDCYEEFSKP